MQRKFFVFSSKDPVKENGTDGRVGHVMNLYRRIWKFLQFLSSEFFSEYNDLLFFDHYGLFEEKKRHFKFPHFSDLKSLFFNIPHFWPQTDFFVIYFVLRFKWLLHSNIVVKSLFTFVNLCSVFLCFLSYHEKKRKHTVKK